MDSRLDTVFRDTVGDRRPAFFLDYDGTLVPIVEDPDDAVLPEATRRTLRDLAERSPVAVVSGRDRHDVEERVDLPGIWYAGCHGFDIRGPGGEIVFPGVERLAHRIATAAEKLTAALREVPGSRVEPKRYTVAVHYRQVADADRQRLDEIVDRVVGDLPELSKTGGKMVWEIRPDLPWDKGRAVVWMLDALGLDRPDVVPVYIGDDETDEDAFRALEDRGIGILVGGDLSSSAARYRLSGPREVRKLLASTARWPR